MHEPQDARPRARSPFAAAFLSLIFPGLGHATPARRRGPSPSPPRRSCSSPCGAGIVLRVDRIELLGLLLNPFLLSSVFVVNLDRAALPARRDRRRLPGGRVTSTRSTPAGDGRLGPAAAGARNPLSIAGLLAVILVMAGSHVVVARYDMLAHDVLDSGCIFVGDTATAQCDADAVAEHRPASTGRARAERQRRVRPPTEPPVPGAAGGRRAERVDPAVGRQGAAQHPAHRRRPAARSEGTFNTDTLIVVSIDPVTKQVAMFSLPRDTVDVPIPPGPARQVFGSVYPSKINSLVHVGPQPRRPLPRHGRDARLQRPQGHPRQPLRPRHQVLRRGQLRRLQEGRRRARRGHRSTSRSRSSTTTTRATTGSLERIYIPGGIQHMNGAQALHYARSRHGSNDFDRGARQQRVLLSLAEQADPQALIPQLPGPHRRAQVGRSARTSRSTSSPTLLGPRRARSTPRTSARTSSRRRSTGSEYPIEPARLHHRARTSTRSAPAVKHAFTVDPADEAQREKLAEEGASVWVLNGSGDRDRAARPRRLPRVPRAWPRRRPRQKPPGRRPRRHDDRRLQRRRRTRWPTRSPTSRSASG